MVPMASLNSCKSASLLKMRAETTSSNDCAKGAGQATVDSSFRTKGEGARARSYVQTQGAPRRSATYV